MLPADYTPPNLEPFFDTKLVQLDLTINLATNKIISATGDQEVDPSGEAFAYPLPLAIDSNFGDTVSIELSLDVDYISFDQANNSLVFNFTEIQDLDEGSHSVKILLKDSQGGTTAYTFLYTISLE